MFTAGQVVKRPLLPAPGLGRRANLLGRQKPRATVSHVFGDIISRGLGRVD